MGQQAVEWFLVSSIFLSVKKHDGDFVRYDDYVVIEAENTRLGRTLYKRNNELWACESELDAALAELAALKGGRSEEE